MLERSISGLRVGWKGLADNMEGLKWLQKRVNLEKDFRKKVAYVKVQALARQTRRGLLEGLCGGLVDAGLQLREGVVLINEG